MIGSPKVQPVAALQVSMPLHGSPSSQLSGAPAVQPVSASPVSGLQVSMPLQTSPSAQSPSMASWRHPASGWHESVVHEISSSQSVVVPEHEVSVHTSSVVHGFPSSQSSLFGVNVHPFAKPNEYSHASSVHGFPSSQSSSEPEQAPWSQKVFELHGFPSSQGSS